MLLKENTNLEEDIIRYNSPYNKSFEFKKHVGNLLIIAFTGILSAICLVDVFHIYKSMKELLAIFVVGPGIASCVSYYYVKKNKIKDYENAKANLAMISEVLNINHVKLNRENLKDAKIVKEEVKRIKSQALADEKVLSSKKFYLFDREEKIRILQEFRNMITFKGYDINYSELYLKEDISDEEILEAKKLLNKTI